MASTPDASGTAIPKNEHCAQCMVFSTTLKRCARCKTVAYCNRECQTAHWSSHKQQCKQLASMQGAQEAPQGEVPRRSYAKPFTAIYHNNFLHNRPKSETFSILIDILRMRQEDAYRIDGEKMTGTIYSTEETSEPAFRTFIQLARTKPGFLPPWTDANTVECIRFSRHRKDFSLRHAVKKHDVQEQWSDDLMPMKLRMLAEKVYGNVPGGSQGASMMAMMMKFEDRSAAGKYTCTFHAEHSSGQRL